MTTAEATSRNRPVTRIISFERTIRFQNERCIGCLEREHTCMTHCRQHLHLSPCLLHTCVSIRQPMPLSIGDSVDTNQGFRIGGNRLVHASQTSYSVSLHHASLPHISALARVQAPGPEQTSSVCLTCATLKKSGKRSCCARGGSWYNDCGPATELRFGHTWVEGLRACALNQVERHVMSGLEKPMVQPPNATTTRKISFIREISQHTSIAYQHTTDTGSNGVTAGSTGRNELAILAVFYSIFFSCSAP